MYWSVRGAVDGNGLFRGPLRDFRRSQTLDCPDGAPVQETIFLSPLLLDFVLEPDVFIYFTDGDSLYFIGFDKQNNGSIMKSNQILVESFGEVTVTITPTEMGPYAVMCNATASACSDAPAEYTGADVINDILVFRKSKQPLPGMYNCVHMHVCVRLYLVSYEYFVLCTHVHMYKFMQLHHHTLLMSVCLLDHLQLLCLGRCQDLLSRSLVSSASTHKPC